jgi:glucosyl-dolichyl phosphate glucuronosyltransferase
MKLTVAICTWNRADLLETTLESLSQLSPNDRGEWELVLVDNNSTDRTTEVCRRYEDKLPLRYSVESVQGHAASRNRAISLARGDWILWTDDDVIVRPNWLGGYRRAIGRFPETAFLGGPVELKFLGRVPRWVVENQQVCDGVFARRQLGSQPVLLDRDTLPFGANFATRVDVQRRFLFRTEFGRVGAGVRGYDEIDVLGRMLDAGFAGRWVPEAAVEHQIPASRTTIRYVYDYFFGQGQTWVVRGLCRESPTQLGKQIRHHRMRYWLGRFIGRSKLWFPNLVRLANLEGQRDALASGKPDNDLKTL